VLRGTTTKSPTPTNGIRRYIKVIAVKKGTTHQGGIYRRFYDRELISREHSLKRIPSWPTGGQQGSFAGRVQVVQDPYHPTFMQ